MVDLFYDPVRDIFVQLDNSATATNRPQAAASMNYPPVTHWALYVSPYMALYPGDTQGYSTSPATQSSDEEDAQSCNTLPATPNADEEDAQSYSTLPATPSADQQGGFEEAEEAFADTASEKSSSTACCSGCHTPSDESATLVGDSFSSQSSRKRTYSEFEDETEEDESNSRASSEDRIQARFDEFLRGTGYMRVRETGQIRKIRILNNHVDERDEQIQEDDEETQEEDEEMQEVDEQMQEDDWGTEESDDEDEVSEDGYDGDTEAEEQERRGVWKDFCAKARAGRR